MRLGQLTNRPTGDINKFSFIRYFKPSGSQTLLFIKNMITDRMVHLLRWGDKIYLPVDIGEQIGIGIYNGWNVWTAYPTYIEASNLYVGGPSEPEKCSTDFMWELQPGMTQVFSHLVNPNAQSGRVLQIVESGQGFAIGEATFGTTQYRGQIRVYERLQRYNGAYQAYRRTNAGTGYKGFTTRDDGGFEGTLGATRGTTLGGGKTETFELEDLGDMSFSDTTRGAKGGHTFSPKSLPQAGIGAGEEQKVRHINTGISYQHRTQPVAALNVERREHLQQMLTQAWGYNWSWWFNAPFGDFWWDSLSQDTQFGGHPSTAPHIPFAPKPHEGR